MIQLSFALWNLILYTNYFVWFNFFSDAKDCSNPKETGGKKKLMVDVNSQANRKAPGVMNMNNNLCRLHTKHNCSTYFLLVNREVYTGIEYLYAWSWSDIKCTQTNLIKNYHLCVFFYHWFPQTKFKLKFSFNRFSNHQLTIHIYFY